jgi:hypothetical protein
MDNHLLLIILLYLFVVVIINQDLNINNFINMNSYILFLLMIYQMGHHHNLQLSNEYLKDKVVTVLILVPVEIELLI